jgi:hypothetical protein
MSKKMSFLSVAVSILLVCPLFAEQINSTWVGGYGDWGSATMWNPVGVPNNGGSQTFSVIIDGTSENANVGFYNSFTIDSLVTYGEVRMDKLEFSPMYGLTVLNGLDNYGELDLYMSVDGDVNNHPNAAISIDREIEIWGGVVNNSNATIDISEHVNIYGDLINNANGTIIFFQKDSDVHGNDNDGKVINNGLIQCFSDGSVGEVALFENNGQIQLYGGGGNGEVFDNNTAGTIKGWGTVTGGQLQNDGSIEAAMGQLLLHFDSVTNKGLFKNNPGTSMFVHTSGSDVNNQGTVEINAGGSLVCDTNLLNQPSSVTMLKGGTLAALNITQKAGAIFEGDGKISGNLVIEPNAVVALTGPTEIYGDVQIDANAVLDINDGTTLIKGHCTCNNGTIHLKGGWIIPQGGLTNNNCNILWEPGLYNNIADFNLDGKVDFKDFASFADTWLWQTQW